MKLPELIMHNFLFDLDLFSHLENLINTSILKFSGHQGD